MDLRRLRLFLAVVDHGGMTRAAEFEHVSQPSVSQAVRELEAELGTPLFHRVGRGVVPTAAGEALVGPARQVLRDVEVGQAAVAAVAGLASGRLDLVALPTLVVDPVAPLVGAFRLAHPGVTIALADPADAGELDELVATGACEIGVTVDRPSAATLATHVLGSQDLLAVLPPGTEISRRSAVHHRAGALSLGDRAGGYVDAHAARRRLRRRRGHPGHRGRRRATRGDPAHGPRGRRRDALPPPARRAGRTPRGDDRAAAAAPHPTRPPRAPRRPALSRGRSVRRRWPSSAPEPHSTGRPAAFHAWKPPARSVARCSPRSCRLAAARLDA